MTYTASTELRSIDTARLGDRPALARLLSFIDSEEPRIRALVDEPDRAARWISEFDQCPEGPLYRVPVGVKDIFHVEGLETRAGTRLPPAALGGEEAASVARLKRAGGLILGKTVTTEFAYFAPGPTRNPLALDHTPGGSSSGSAAAVAAGYCPLALGTQTIGSICRPASYCGVVGFKPSYGRISTDGVIPLAPSLDHIGIFTRSVADTATAAAILCRDWQPIDGDRRPRLGLPLGPYLERATATGRALFDRVCARLARHAWQIEPVTTLADFAAIEQRHQIILAAEAARVHIDWYGRFSQLYHPRTRDLVERGRTIGDRALAAALADRDAFGSRLMQEMDDRGIDLWISPAATGTAPHGLASTGDPVMNLPWTQAGLPAISLPAIADDDGLPLGLQVVGKLQADESLLHWAAELETTLAAGA